MFSPEFVHLAKHGYEVTIRDDRIIFCKGVVSRRDCLYSVVPITATGKDLAAGESVSGTLTQKLPLDNRCEPAEGALDYHFCSRGG